MKIIVAQKSTFNYKPSISTSSEFITIVIDVDRYSPLSLYGRQNEATFTPLPVNALGREYVVSSCHKSETGTTSMLLVTGYKQTANVNVRFPNEQTFTANGNSYVNETEYILQVFAYESLVLLSKKSFAETRILSDNVIAVYSGVLKKNFVRMYTQLLPVSNLGNSFHVYFDESRMSYEVHITSVYNVTGLNRTPFALRSFRGTISYSSSNNLVDLEFPKPTSSMLCGKDSLRGMAVLPPQALFQTQVFLPLNGDTIIIVHPHRQNSVNVSDRIVQENVQWRFTSETHVGVVRTPSVPGQSLVITARESFYVIAASENHIYTAGFSPSYQPIEQVGERVVAMGDLTVGSEVAVVAGVAGVSLIGTLFIGGAVYSRQRRQNRDRGDQAEEQGGNYPPAVPPPPRVAV